MRVLTTTIKPEYPAWGHCTELLPGWEEQVERTFGRRVPASVGDAMRWGWKLFRKSRFYDAVVTGFERESQCFALLQRVLRRTPVPHVFLYACRNLPQSRIKRWLARVFFRQLVLAASRTVVYSQRQLGLYAAAFNLPKEKFVCIPYYPTLYGAEYTVKEGDYIFAGGDYTRDYAGFIEAVRPLPYRVVIAAFFRHYFRNLTLPATVEIVTVSHDQFLALMAGAGVVVVPLRGGLLHSGGQQTYLNAMAMGKPVVVTDDAGAEEYIQHGKTGMVLKPGDPLALRRAIQTLMEDRALARAMGAEAKVAARAFSPARFFDEVLSVTEACVALRMKTARAGESAVPRVN